MDLPTKQAAAEAGQLVATEFFLPALVEKLAAYGIQPKNEAELEQLIQLGAMLQQAEEQGTFKAASDAPQGNRFLQHAIDKLAAANKPGPAATEQQLLVNAVEVAKTNPLAKAAALIFAHATNGGELADDQAS